ncbi:hypothetical protein HWV62_13084 [Athelia sp. TMB]|nr:hypothetical protein HWV62_13084 [Athelia sp. TMB]
MPPAPVVFNTPNASGNAQINNINGDFINTQNVYAVTQDREKIYHWLAAPDTSGNYNAAREKHHENTGAWFLEGDVFVHWKDTPGSALWINGTPGSGKTIICRNAETDQSLHEKMLRSLIRQLSHQWGLWYRSRQSDQSATSQQQIGVPAALVDLYGGGHEKPSTAALQLTLQNIIADFDRTYIVLDALDECLDRHKLLAWIGSLVQRSMTQLHMLFSSRREQDILQRFEPMESVCPVSLEGASANSDIERYVDDMLATVARWNVATRARIKHSLMEGVDGMFRWIALQIAELFKCLTPRAVDAQLRSLPKDLDGMYEQTLTRSANAEQLKLLLIWLAFSVRHLLIEELAEVIAIDFSLKDAPAYDPDLRYFSPTDVLDFCAGFVTCVPINARFESSIEHEGAKLGSKGRVHRKDIYTHSREATDVGTIKLAHMSVKDYLVSERIKNGAASCFGINATLAHTKITATCLAYLLHLGSRSSFDDEATFKDFPLVSYAARHWLQHIESGLSNEAPVWQLMIRMFSRGHNALTNCIKLQDPHRRDRWDTVFYYFDTKIKGTPPLYYASLLGMEELVEEILSRGEDVQARGGPCDNALQAASYHGHEGVVRILLEHGAHVNTRGGNYSNALRAAFYGGHINVARLLLDHNADVTAREEHEGTLLQEAALHNDFATVQLLLKYSADANALAGPKGTSLQIASGRGEDDIVRLLLEHGADVNAPAGPEGTALQVAISWPDPDKVRQSYSPRSPPLDLIEPNKPDCTSLEASRRGCAIVRVLLERGAEVNAPAGPKGTALQIACGRGEIDIVRLLLEHEADVNAPAGPKGTALQAVIRWASLVGTYEPGFTSQALEASHRGFAIVRLLLEYGVDINAPGGAVLQDAASYDHSNIVQLLLEHGADVNAPAGPKGTALQVASNWPSTAQRREVVRLLIENGANVNAPGPSGTALSLASRMGDKVGVQLMLERGAVMGPQEAEVFIFEVYKERNHAEILQLLLDSGAGVDWEWLYRKRVEWFREGRIEVEDYDRIELWGMSSLYSKVSEQDSDGEQWYTADEGSAPASPVQNTL